MHHYDSGSSYSAGQMRQHDSFSVIVLVVSPFRLSFRGAGVAETLPVARLWMIADRRGSASAVLLTIDGVVGAASPLPSEDS